MIDAAIKAQIKQENDFSGLALQKQAMKERIEAMAEARDVGQAMHVADAMSANSYPDYNGWSGFGSGWDGW